MGQIQVCPQPSSFASCQILIFSIGHYSLDTHKKKKHAKMEATKRAKREVYLIEGRRQWLKKFLGGVFGAFGIASGAAALNRGLTDEEARQVVKSIRSDIGSSSCPISYCPRNYCMCFQNAYCPHCHGFYCPNYSPSPIPDRKSVV